MKDKVLVALAVLGFSGAALAAIPGPVGPVTIVPSANVNEVQFTTPSTTIDGTALTNLAKVVFEVSNANGSSQFAVDITTTGVQDSVVLPAEAKVNGLNTLKALAVTTLEEVSDYSNSLSYTCNNGICSPLGKPAAVTGLAPKK